MKQINTPKLKDNQLGMASILITMVTMVVISLIVLGFAVISRREQTKTLNQQLSTQAFYAAETGVNDVVHLAQQQVADGNALPPKTSCQDNSYPYDTLDSTISSANGVSYSCLLVYPEPKVLSYGDISSSSTVIPLKSAGNNIASLTLQWTAKGNNSNPMSGCSGSSNISLPKVSSWSCGYGLLRFDLVPTAGNSTIANLQAKDMIRFMVPGSGSGTGSMSYAPSPSTKSIYRARCNDTNCTLTIRGLDSSEYYMRVMSLYQDSGLKISAKDSSGDPLGLKGAQIAVDVTGKAHDVLRRIKVSVSIANTNQQTFPDDGLQSAGSICKRFSVSDSYFQNVIPAGVSGTDRLCNN